MSKHDQWKATKRKRNRRNIRRETIRAKQAFVLDGLNNRIRESF